jgi:glycosyltransferase involved in cell wall biosynthesis
MGELLDDPLRRRRMGAEGRALIERRFDVHRQTEALESLYDTLFANAPDSGMSTLTIPG